MRILLASNSYKECATASEVNNSIEQGILLFKLMFVNPADSIEIDKIEICDGGTGFASILTSAVNGLMHNSKAFDPLKRSISASYGVSSDKQLVFIEVAETCGLARLTKSEQNPANTSSFGVGVQFNNAIETYNPSRIFLGCGDTAINDFGIGFLSALGVRFFDKCGVEVYCDKPSDFLEVDNLDFTAAGHIDYLLKKCKVTLCCNLSSVIGGSESNTKAYAKQKGASVSEIEMLEKVRDNFIRIVKKYTKKDISLIPGTGAGGGIGAALYAFCNAKLSYSFEEIFKILDVETRIKSADLVITGEGLVDGASLKGKAPISLALYAKKHNKKVGLIAGAIKTNCTNIIVRGGVDYVETLTNESFNLNEYIINSHVLLRDAGFRLMKKIYK